MEWYIYCWLSYCFKLKSYSLSALISQNKFENGPQMIQLVKTQCNGQIGIVLLMLRMGMILRFWKTMSSFLGEFQVIWFLSKLNDKVRHTILEFAHIQRISKQGMSAIKSLGLVLKRFLSMIWLQNQHPKETGPMGFHETLGKFEKV